MDYTIGNDATSLARTASIALADNASGVGYAISHIVDRPWHFREIIERTNREAAQFFGAPGGGIAVWTEGFGSAAFGSGVLILVTRTGEVRGRVLSLDVAESFSVIEDHDVQAFVGTAPPNPSFLYRGSRYTEVYLRIPQARRAYDLRDALALGTVVRELSSAGVEQRAPILFLQSPAAAPAHSPRQVGQDERTLDVTNDATWRTSQAFGVRFAVGLDPLNADGRIRFFGRLGD
ncbi:MAG: hypothetical protein LC808_29350, partial [Actinobacteria bacterium]|nr:hypothetical protein [Actinomycetota bacterium]